MNDRPNPNVRLTVSIDLAWPNPEIVQGTADSRYLSDKCHDAIAGAVHQILEAGDPDDTYNMVVVVEDSSVLRDDE